MSSFKDGDTVALYCPFCYAVLYETHFFNGTHDLDRDELDESVRAHMAKVHRWRYRLIRWLSKEWYP